MPSPRVTAVLNEVQAERARQRKFLTHLSAATGQSPTALSRKLNGHVEFTMGELDAVCEALGVPLAEMTRRAQQHAAVAS